MDYTRRQIAKMIDHSLLNPVLGDEELEKGCRAALADGAGELDMVVNVGKVLSADWDFVRQDVKEVVDCAHAAGAKVKVIFENCYLEDDHKIRLCEICGELNADWVKTSTGYGTGGATLDDPA